MIVATSNDRIRDLIKNNWDAEPGIVETYLFKPADEIRIVHVDQNSPAADDNDELTPFYFRPSLGSGLGLTVAVVLINPRDIDHRKPPKGWGEWSDAERLIPAALSSDAS